MKLYPLYLEELKGYIINLISCFYNILEMKKNKKRLNYCDLKNNYQIA